MKHIVVFGICFCISIIFWLGCKTTQHNEIDPNASIIGTWELRNTTAAMNPVAHTYPAGNGNKYKFSATNYEVYINGVLDKTGTYQIVNDPSVSQSVCLEIPAGQYNRRIIFDTNNDPKTFFHIIDNNLYFIAGCYALDGGHTSEYKKQ